MADEKKQELLRTLPSVDAVMQVEDMEALMKDFPRWFVLDCVRDTLDAKRKEILAGDAGANPASEGLSAEKVALEVGEKLRGSQRFSLKRVINATGIILHTNLGRAVLGQEVLRNILAVGGTYSNLEYNLEAGQRGSRHSHLEGILTRLTGAEAALVVNNNAAAVLLALDTLAKDREVIVSRGELIEIGGSFRIPDIMSKSGAQLKEVGTTNRTHLKDYASAVTDNTALLLKVHTSNYRIVGFTTEVALEELVELGREYQIPVMEDLGSGNLTPSAGDTIIPEPTVQDKIKAGIDLITFSGDKLLGGPQAGIILGKDACVSQLAANPLARALRVDKFTIAALEATLHLYLEGGEALMRIPTMEMLSRPVEEQERKALALADMMKDYMGEKLSVSVSRDVTQAGGGSLPGVEFPTAVAALTSTALSPEEIDERLRKAKIPILGRISQDRFLLDMRTVQEDELQEIASAVKQLAEELR